MNGAIMLPKEKSKTVIKHAYGFEEDVNAFSSIEEDMIHGFQEGEVYTLGYLDNLEETWVKL